MVQLLPDSLPVVHAIPSKHVHIDAATAANLELLPGGGARHGASLVELLDHTRTKGGGALSASVEQPSET